MTNRVELEGGLARSPDFGFTGTGRCWCRFTLAVAEVGWDAKNQREAIETTWVSCQAWGYVAEQLMKDDPVKGEKLHVTGRLSQSEREVDGKKETKTRVEVATYSFTSRKVREPEFV